MIVTIREGGSVPRRDMVEKEETDIPEVRPTTRLGW